MSKESLNHQIWKFSLFQENHLLSDLLLVFTAETADFLRGKKRVVEDESDVQIERMLIEQRYATAFAILTVLLL